MLATQSDRNSRRLRWACVGVGVSVLLYLVPPFHIVPLEAVRSESAAAAFDAGSFVETYWTELILESADRAVDAGELLAAFEADPADAVQRYGHRLGLSGASSYFVSASGHIIAVDDRSIAIALDDGDAAAVVIETGPLFGNAVRDGSGMLDVSDFPNSQDFNALSSEINRRVEERVFPELRERAAIGVVVKFVGGVEIADEEKNFSPLKLVPVVVEFP